MLCRPNELRDQKVSSQTIIQPDQNSQVQLEPMRKKYIFKIEDVHLKNMSNVFCAQKKSIKETSRDRCIFCIYILCNKYNSQYKIYNYQHGF